MVPRAKNAQPISVGVNRPAEIKRATDAARDYAQLLGFAATDCDEIALVVSELASNVIKHASGGRFQFTSLERGGRTGLCIECEDSGGGLTDPGQALTDGYSTTGSLGIGLGAVNRLMDDLELHNRAGEGLRVVCHRWIRSKPGGLAARLLEFGVATRACRQMPENGDAFVIKCWENNALAGVLDGLGHGPPAQRAAQTARQYIEQHFDQPLENLFLGVERACRATRGVVMALARFDLTARTITVANIGNIEVRILRGSAVLQPILRRGILGLNAPKPVLSRHSWSPEELLVMHSDGVRGHWQWDQFSHLSQRPPNIIASELLASLGKPEDDATVLVVKSMKEL